MIGCCKDTIFFCNTSLFAPKRAESPVYRLLFPDDCYDELPGTAITAILTEVDTLPGAEVQMSVSNGDGDADTTQCRFGVSRHIVSTL